MANSLQNEKGKMQERIRIILRFAIQFFHFAMKFSQFFEGLNCYPPFYPKGKI
jgi:hypothetical protein